MSNYIVIDGDPLEFDSLFGINTVTLTSIPEIRGSGEATIEGKKICIYGDEKNVSVSASYSNASYPTKGIGRIVITVLAGDQQADFATTTTPVILVGSKFTASFTPEVPASGSNGPDPVTAPSTGTGIFINSQSFVTAG
ncbi:hypothetical protein [Enterobacter ludwigii]